MSTSTQFITELGHVALEVRDLDAAVENATQVMGLRVTDRDDHSVYLTSGTAHHELVYTDAATDAVGHIGLVATGPAALDALRRRAADEGLEIVSNEPLTSNVESGFALRGPEGFVYDISVGMQHGQPPYDPTGVRPTRLGHVNLHPTDPEVTCRFLTDVLGFRVSDVIDGEGYFLRCNADQHAIALIRGRGTLHHHAWEVESIADLGRLADHLDDRGEHMLWGPLRHGAGRNIAAYYAEPSGAVVEYYADMEQVYNEERRGVQTWSADDSRWYSLWTKGRPADFRDYGLPPAER